MRYDVECPACGHTDEIVKPMAAGYPHCPKCKGQMRRVFTDAAPVHFAAAGFFSSDTRFERSLPPARYARFAAQKADAERRAAAGQLTDYEKALERD
jgi:putative FmdB family regulatory protein